MRDMGKYLGLERSRILTVYQSLLQSNISLKTKAEVSSLNEIPEIWVRSASVRL